MIQLNQTAGDYAIRVSSSSTPQLISGYGVLSYAVSGTTGTVVPPPKKQALGYGGDTLPGYTELVPTTLQPFPTGTTPPKNSNVTLVLELEKLSNLTWAMNQFAFSCEFLGLAWNSWNSSSGR